jgi:hypothetical protein
LAFICYLPRQDQQNVAKKAFVGIISPTRRPIEARSKPFLTGATYNAKPSARPNRRSQIQYWTRRKHSSVVVVRFPLDIRPDFLPDRKGQSLRSVSRDAVVAIQYLGWRYTLRALVRAVYFLFDRQSDFGHFKFGVEFGLGIALGGSPYRNRGWLDPVHDQGLPETVFQAANHRQFC